MTALVRRNRSRRVEERSRSRGQAYLIAFERWCMVRLCQDQPIPILRGIFAVLQQRFASILGEKTFRESIKERETEIRASGDLSQVLSERPDFAEIVSAVSKVFKATPEKITKRYVGRQDSNVARQVAIYCCQYLGDQSLRQIAENFGFSHVGSVSPAVSAIKKQLQVGQLSKEYKKVEKLLNVIK